MRTGTLGNKSCKDMLEEGNLLGVQENRLHSLFRVGIRVFRKIKKFNNQSEEMV